MTRRMVGPPTIKILIIKSRRYRDYRCNRIDNSGVSSRPDALSPAVSHLPGQRPFQTAAFVLLISVPCVKSTRFST